MTTKENETDSTSRFRFGSHHSNNKPFAKFIGVCTHIDTAVVKCLKQERIARSAANRAKAFERQARIKQRLLQESESS